MIHMKPKLLFHHTQEKIDRCIKSFDADDLNRKKFSPGMVH